MLSCVVVEENTSQMVVCNRQKDRAGASHMGHLPSLKASRFCAS